MSLDPMPERAPLDTAGRVYLSPDWYRWLYALWSQLNSTAKKVGATVGLTGLHASIPLTALPVPGITAGTYRVSWYARITTAATTSSSLTITVGWTENGQALTGSGPAITTNLTTSGQSGSFVLHVDGLSPITYSTSYVSTGATAMVYRLDLLVEAVN